MFRFDCTFSNFNYTKWVQLHTILRPALSPYVYNAFIAVGCTFGVLCSHQSYSYQTMQSKDLC